MRWKGWVKPWGPHSSFPSPWQNSRENNLRRAGFLLAHNHQRFLSMATDLVNFCLRRDISKMAVGTRNSGFSSCGSQEMEQMGGKERRKGRRREGREGGRRDKPPRDLLPTVSPHFVTFYGLPITPSYWTEQWTRSQLRRGTLQFCFPPPLFLDSATGRTPAPTWGLLLIQPEDQSHPQEHCQANLLQMPCLLRNFYIWV